MTFVWLRSATLFPQIFAQPGAVIIALTVGHQRSQISREVFGVSIVLDEKMLKVFLGKQARTAGPNEAAIPDRMLCLKMLQFSKSRIRDGRRCCCSSCVLN